MKLRFLVLLCMASVASAQKYYDKTTVPPSWVDANLNFFPTNLNISKSLTKSGASALPSQFGELNTVSLTGSPTGTDNSMGYSWTCSSDNQAGRHYLPGCARFLYNFGGANLTGGRSGLSTIATFTAPSGNPSIPFDSDYVAASSNMYVNSGDGGDAITPYGKFYAYVPQVRAGPGATFIDGLFAEEIDISCVGCSVGLKEGVKLVQTSDDTTAGTTFDAGFSFQSSSLPASGPNPGWRTVLSFGGPEAYSPVAVTGTLIGGTRHSGGNIMAAGRGIDFTNFTFSSNAFESTGFSVDGSGNLTAASISAAGAKIPYILAQSAIPFILPGSGTMGDNGALSGVAALAATVPKAYVFAYPGTIGNATISALVATNTTGSYTCTCTNVAVGQYVTISGAWGTTTPPSAYSDPTTFYVSATNGTSTLTLQTIGRVGLSGATAGTPSGLTIKAGGGWFYATGGSTTTYTLFNNLYVSGTPTIPASPTAFSTTGITAYTATINIGIYGPLYTLAASALGLDGALDTNMYFKYNNSATAKTATLFLGGVQLLTAGPTTTTGVVIRGTTTNVGSASVQETWQTQLNTAATSSLVEQAAGAQNTAVSTNVWVRFLLAATTDVLEVQSYSVEVRPN